jgi:SNF2 family DNA or RNA helicase
MLDLIEAYLRENGFSYLKLTGATKDRQFLVERFQGGEGEVFLISLKAGGTGLTLTGADTVIHYDPWWNPAAENQATDRAYRIGQDKPVFVHKLICRQTVEERIQLMQEKKDDLASDLLSGAVTGLNLTPETMAGLLGNFS